jgi:AbrB family looped-hinge helix DNA binding protein
MAKATIRYLDEKKRRIVIPKEITELENIHEGDFIEIDVRRIEKPSKMTA